MGTSPSYNLAPMRLAGSLFLAVAIVAACLLAAAEPGSAEREKQRRSKPAVITDGRLRPGHLEIIRLSGFPGKGVTGISFFPTAICEDSCGVRVFEGGRTNSRGAARLRVRVPGTFLDHRDRLTYFRDGERIEVNVTWQGSGGRFASADAKPEPIIVRTHD